MASPATGVDANKWAQGHVAGMRRKGLNPAALGFTGPQQERDDWSRESQRRQDQPQTGGPGPLPSSQSGGDFSAYTPGRAQSQQSPYAAASPYGQQGQMMQLTGGPATDPRWSHNGGQWQSGQPQMPAFQFSGGSDWTGNQFTNPSAMLAQQGAMAQALNQQRSQQVAQGNFAPLSPQLAYQQGAQMIQDGWQNPFAAPAWGGFPDYAGAGVRNLIGNPGPATGYGTPPELRGQDRVTWMQDREGDGVDDRDQDGPGMPSYGMQSTQFVNARPLASGRQSYQPGPRAARQDPPAVEYEEPPAPRPAARPSSARPPQARREAAPPPRAASAPLARRIGRGGR